ncbi:MAG: aldehyde ferredoxin oxidoreductase family protein [Thermoplasmata archaeon]|jgi:aldehyde:ferredoxin oxidoreductase|nr:aldehyde ferredoxin oxidoreductase family protein [Thermoplasmata archaeon]
MKGYTGKILKVDLTEEKSHERTFDESYARKYLGGQGFAVELVYHGVPKGSDPLGPKNVLAMAGGTFDGFPVGTGGKVAFAAKSPATGTLAESIMGGSIGPELRHAGYDALEIVGKAESPSYIWIDNGTVEVKDASDLWGKDTREVPEILKKRHGWDVKVACIGVAGEKLSRLASIDCDDRQAGRAGLGAVMGSKNLKAIVIRGTKDLVPADPKKLLDLALHYQKIYEAAPSFVEDTKYGTGEFLGWVNKDRGVFPTRNWQEGVFNEREKIDPYYWATRYVTKNKACFACTKPCGKLFEVKSGKFAGVAIDGIEYETLYSLGGACGNSDVESVAKANELCDLLGLDTISAGVTVGFAMELFQRGIITESETGVNLAWSNASDAVPKMIEMMGNRKGFGDVLADGVKVAAGKIGKGSERYAIHTKGMEPPAYDVRGMKGHGLAYMTSTRGACHLRAGFYAPELVGKFWKWEGIDRFSAVGKGFMVSQTENFMCVYDSVGLCKFSRGFYLIAKLPEVIEAITGLKFSEDELLKIGERIHNMKGNFNAREGVLRKDWLLPARILEDPIPEGVSKGSKISVDEMNLMLDDYMKARGWTSDGVPTPEKLKELGIE